MESQKLYRNVFERYQQLSIILATMLSMCLISISIDSELVPYILFFGLQFMFMNENKSTVAFSNKLNSYQVPLCGSLLLCLPFFIYLAWSELIPTNYRISYFTGVVLATTATFIITLILIHYSHFAFKTFNSFLKKTLTGLFLVLLYFIAFVHMNTFATYSNSIYLVTQHNCFGLCVQVGVGNLTEFFNESEGGHFHPILAHNPYRSSKECSGFGEAPKSVENEWKFEIINHSKALKIREESGYTPLTVLE